MTRTALIVHAIITVALIAAGTALTVSGHDGSYAWGALGGYLGGAGAQAAGTAKAVDG